MRKYSYSHHLYMFHCLNTGKDDNHRCLKTTKKKRTEEKKKKKERERERDNFEKSNGQTLKYDYCNLKMFPLTSELKQVINKSCSRTYLWSSSFLQIHVRKHKCSCSHRQCMFHCFHTGWDNSRQYLTRHQHAHIHTIN